MKKLFIMALVLISLNVSAQKMSVGFNTGLTISKYTSKVDNKTESTDPYAGFTAGMLLDIPVGKHFSFQPGLNYVLKGAKEKNDNAGFTATSKLIIHYLEMPWNFLYNTRGKQGNFFIGAGPAFSVAIGGTAKFKADSISLSEKIHFGNSSDDLMKSTDIGINVLAGYSLKNGITMSVNANKGITDLFPKDSGEGWLKSFYFGIKLGYMLNFGKRK